MTRDEMDEIRRHFDVVAESVVDKIQQVAEGHQVLVAGQERVLARLDRLETRIDRFEMELKGMVNLSFSELDAVLLNGIVGWAETLARRLVELVR